MSTATIPVVSAVGTAATELAAFDAALRGSNVANFNLVRLSSVIPPRTEVVRGGAIPTGAWGDRLYCVYAEMRASTVGEEAWASVGWVQRADGEGGLFVEHEGHSRHEVERLVEASLAELVAGRPERFGSIECVTVGAACEGEPVCALVLAAYDTASWSWAGAS